MKEKASKIIVILSYIICIVLECIPGGIIFATTINQGQTKVYQNIAYISFSYFGAGIILPPVVVILSVLLLLVAVIWLISGLKRCKKELLEVNGFTLGINLITICGSYFISQIITIISILITAALIGSMVVLKLYQE